MRPVIRKCSDHFSKFLYLMIGITTCLTLFGVIVIIDGCEWISQPNYENVRKLIDFIGDKYQTNQQIIIALKQCFDADSQRTGTIPEISDFDDLRNINPLNCTVIQTDYDKIETDICQNMLPSLSLFVFIGLLMIVILLLLSLSSKCIGDAIAWYKYIALLRRST